MDNNIDLLQLFASNNIGELYPIKVQTKKLPTHGYVCGYSGTDLILGFTDSTIGWINISPGVDTVFRVYPSYHYEPYKP